jgi:FixJ family two-component response regulator
MHPQAMVYVVDDDLSIREALSSLIRSVGLPVKTYASAIEFLAMPQTPNVVSCLILDIRMPELNGLDLQTKLIELGQNLPIIFITGHGDIPMAVRAMKQGAIEFLPKPFRDEDLLTAIEAALAQARNSQQTENELDKIRRHYALLTNREKEVLVYMVKGTLNKQTAAELGISEITIKVHRHNVMQKMQAETVPDLVRMMERLKTLNNS